MRRKSWAAAGAAILGLAIPGWSQQTEPDTAPAAEFGGPAILTRGAGSLFRVPTSSLKFQPFASFMGTYDGGLGGVVIQPDGQPQTLSSSGVQVGGGVTGYLRRRLDQIGLTYDGSYSHFTRNQFYNGTNQSLTLGYQRQLSRNLSMSIREMAGISSRATFGLGGGGFGFVDPQFAGVPQTELFDNRVAYTSTLFDMTYRRSSRLSFNMGGDFMAVKRRSSALFGFNVGRARGDMAYRISRRTTIGAGYEFDHFEFSKAFGASDIHGVKAFWSSRVARYLELSLEAGGQRIETLGIGRVEIPRELQEIFGQAYGLEAVYRVNYIPAFHFRATSGGRYHSTTFDAQTGVAPGNGIYLTSRQNSLMVDYRYTGIRKWTLSAGGGHTQFSSLAQTIGVYKRYSVGGGLARSLLPATFLNIRADWYTNDVQATTFNRDSYRAMIGLTFTPSEFPISIW